MKIALLTIWHERNYGAEMQAYATIKALTQLGYDVELIDIRLSDQNNLTLKRLVIDFLSYLGYADYKFRRFWKRFFPKTRRYKTVEELKKNPPKADVYLVGSDQVWNPEITKKFADVFFLDFGDSLVKRVSYASSFGGEWNGSADLTESAKVQLSKFDIVTTRESDGVEILKKIFNVQSTCVLDPTLLHSDYSELLGCIEEKKTLVYYPLSPFDELQSCAQSLAKELDLQYINSNKKTYSIRRIVWNRPGVDEWVKYISEAKFVITPSFHGLSFSLIYHRQFAIVMNPNGLGRISRIKNLLELLSLEDRLFYSVSEFEKSKIWEKAIDYDLVDAKLNLLRDESWNILRKIDKLV